MLPTLPEWNPPPSVGCLFLHQSINLLLESYPTPLIGQPCLLSGNMLVNCLDLFSLDLKEYLLWITSKHQMNSAFKTTSFWSIFEMLHCFDEVAFCGSGYITLSFRVNETMESFLGKHCALHHLCVYQLPWYS